MYSLADTLESVSFLIPEQFIDGQCMEQIKAIGRRFPAAISSTFGFESRLGEPDAHTDFAFCVMNRKEERDIIAGYDPRNSLPECFSAHPTWRRIENFCKRWANPATSFHYNVDQIWLEFDINGNAQEPPIPGFLFGLDKLFTKTFPELMHGEWNTEKYGQIITEGIEILSGTPPSPGLRANLKRCFRALPPGAKIVQAGLMLSRNVNAIRFFIRHLEKEPLLMDFLAKIGWNGSIAHLMEVYRFLRSHVKATVIAVDIGEEIYSKIGIECYLDYYPEGKQQRDEFIGQLVKRGLCTPQKGEILRNWHGYSQQIMKHEFWPSLLVKMLNHIKIVYQPDSSIEAKGYMGFVHKWIGAFTAKC